MCRLYRVEIACLAAEEESAVFGWKVTELALTHVQECNAIACIEAANLWFKTVKIACEQEIGVIVVVEVCSDNGEHG